MNMAQKPAEQKRLVDYLISGKTVANPGVAWYNLYKTISRLTCENLLLVQMSILWYDTNV